MKGSVPVRYNCIKPNQYHIAQRTRSIYARFGKPGDRTDGPINIVWGVGLIDLPRGGHKLI